MNSKDLNKNSKTLNGRRIFIGDVHGCIVELKNLLEKISPSKKDRIILLGDLVNKGPCSAEVVDFVASNSYESLMGNHDYEYLHQIHKTERANRLYKQLGLSLHKWLSNRPYYIEEKDFIAVHAGLIPNYKLAETPVHILMNIRTWKEDQNDHNASSLEKAELSNAKNPPWYSFYNAIKPVFYGHWAMQGLNLRRNTYGLDSGCVYGKELSAYILEEKRLIQVKAEKTYCPIRKNSGRRDSNPL